MQLGVYKGVIRDALAWYASADRPDPTQTFHRANLPRIGLDDEAVLATGVMSSMPLWLNAGDVVANLTFISGATAAVTPTNQWAALYSTAATPALLSQSPDGTTGAWAADTAKTFTLGTAQKVTSSGIYWVALMVAAATPPSLVGCVGAKPVLTGEGNLGQTSGSALTATAPATIVTPAFKRQVPLVIAN